MLTYLCYVWKPTYIARTRDSDNPSTAPSPEDLDKALPTLPVTRTPSAESGKSCRSLRGKNLLRGGLFTKPVATPRLAGTKEKAKGGAGSAPRRRRHHRHQPSSESLPCLEAPSRPSAREGKARPFSSSDGGVPGRRWVGRNIVWEEGNDGDKQLHSIGSARVNEDKRRACSPTTIGRQGELQDMPWTPTSIAAREVGSVGKLVVLRFVRPFAACSFFSIDRH